MTTPRQQHVNSTQFISGHLVVTNEVNAIIHQGDISVPELPNLPAHQQQARKVGQYWLDSVCPPIKETTMDIIKYAKTFQATYKQLTALVASNPQDLNSKINALLKKLLDDLNTRKDTSSHVEGLVSTFKNQYQTVYDQFEVDYKQASEAITSENQQLQHLHAKKSELQAEANKDNWMSLIPFAGIYYAIEYQKLESEINGISNQINAISHNLGQLQIADNQLGVLQTHASKCLDSAYTVTTGWQSLADNMSEVIQHISSISPGDASIVIKIKLGAANKEWEDVLKQAGQLN